MSETLYTSRDLASWYALGVQHEQERAAGADHEHTEAWSKLGEQVSEARRQQLLRQFERCAEEFHQRELGRVYVPHEGAGQREHQPV